MSDPIVIEVSDKVDSNISKKIKGIANDARQAQTNINSLQDALNSLNSNGISDIVKQSKEMQSSLLAQMKAVQSSTKAINDNSLASAKLATENQRLQTEVAKTGAQSARASIEVARLTTEENKASLAAQKLATEQNKTAKELANSEAAAARAAAAKQRLENAQNKTAESAFNLSNVFKVLVTSMAVNEYIKMSDAVTNLQSRLRLVTTSSQELNAVQEQLYKTAQESRTNYTELGFLYAQIARSAKDAGVSTQGLLGITQTISKAMTISGGSAESMKAALVQLSQGFASGTLRGEELNSVMEQTPRLAQAIAEGLGISIGKLREMGKEGKLTSEAVMGALERSAASVDAEFKKMTPTIGQAFTVLTSALTKTTGEFNEASGASNLLAKGVLAIGGAIDSLGKLIKEYQTPFALLAGGMGGAATGAALVAVGAGLKAVTVGLAGIAAVLAANPVVLALLGIGVAVGVGSAAVNAWNKTETGINRTTEALTKQRDIIEKNLNSGRLDDEQRKANLETLAKVNAQISENNIKVDEMNGRYAQSSLRSQEIQAQNAAEEAGIKKKTDAQSSFKKMMEDLNGVTDEYRKKESEFNKIKDSLTPEQQAQGLAKLKAEYDKITGATKGASTALKEKRSEDLAAIRNQLDLNKLTGQYKKDADSALDAYKRQKINAEDLRKTLTGLITAQETYNEAMRVAKVRQAQVSKDYKDVKDALEDIEKADLDRVKSLRTGNAELEEEIQQLSLSKRGLVQYAYAKNQAAIEDLKFKRVINESNPVLEEQLKLLERRGELILNKGIAEEIQTQKQAYTEFFKDIESGLTESLFNAFQSGGGFAETFWSGVKNMFKTTVLKFAIQGVFGGIMGSVGSALGIPGLSGAGGGLGGLGGIGNILSMGKDVYSAITGGFASLSNNIAYAVQRGLNFLNPSAALGAPGGTAGAIGAAGSVLAGAYGGVMGGRLISGGYSLNGGSGNGTVNAGTGIGAAAGALSLIPGVGIALGALLGGLGGGVINRLFGRKLKESGIEGTFSGEGGFEGRTYEYYKGGLFRSNKTKYGELDEETRSNFAQAYSELRSSVVEMADIVGIGSEALNGFTASFKINLKDLSEADAQAKIAEEFAKIGVSLADLVLGTYKYTLANETSLDTLLRLGGSLGTVNESFKALGKTLLTPSLQSADAAYQLIESFGGTENFNSLTSSFFGNFYSDAEKLTASQTQLNEVFARLNVSVPTTNAAFRELVLSQDVMTESGRKNFATLTAISEQFFTLNETLDAGKQRLISIQEEQHALWADLAEAQGDIGKATQLRYEIEVKGMTDAEKAAYDYNQSIRQQITDAQNAAAALAKVNATLTSLGDTRFDLENQLLTLQGRNGEVTERTRERDLAKLTEGVTAEERERIIAAYDYNLALRQQIAAQQAAASAASNAASAAQQNASAWQSATDSILNQIRALRGEVAESSGYGQSYYQTVYDSLKAKALAGDKDAASMISGAAANLSNSATSEATNLLDLNFFKSKLAADLSNILNSFKQYGVDIPSFATGGYHSGGSFIGNEYGPELMYSPGALNIHNAGETAMMVDNGGVGLGQLAMLLSRLIDGNSNTNAILSGMADDIEETKENTENIDNTLVSVTDSSGTQNLRMVQGD